MSETILTVDDLRKHYGGVKAVDGLSFTIQEGEIVGLIGPNGAGKTTVFNCIMGTVEKTGGSVQFKRTDITGFDTHRIVNEGVSRVSQHSAPLSNMTVRENIWISTLPNTVMALHGGWSDEEIATVAERVGIESRLDEYPSELPHADRRRLEIAKAMANEPDLLLLDEPFAGLNSAEVRTLSDQIRELRDEGVTVIVIDHDMKGLMALVERVIVMHNGQKLMEGDPDEVAENEDVRRVYLAGEGEIE